MLFRAGPWNWHKAGNSAMGSVYAEPRPGHAYAICIEPKYEQPDQWEANARLIAAAPEMLEALQKARDAIAGSDDGDREFILPTIDVVIAKAIQS